ncbi:isocitrate lyase/phosphoenolpyruvate mutase family protein [Acidicapsa dinghuensis]|uniref:Isocitrate lyase/phosphoenolpyruvate mutase family protein n=1 Tax=Acidicapsa dinghuensis TaxID=2218256 RepID=A0ABW1EJU2_9BACT|nr:isocitrate lyase/phosphoenolpyruvate mutase family protein [Acidicapsa dinghuensis]
MDASISVTQAEKAHKFRDLHYRDEAFLLPNPWDVGSAMLLAHMGFEALATTSAGHAFTLGLADNTVPRELVMEHVAALSTATPLPVSCDLGNGFGDEPEIAGEAIRLVASAGAVGGSIEDATGRVDDPIYPIELAVERVRAAAEAARSLDFPFMLTARAENYLNGRPDLGDTIRRLQAFQEAGADVLYAPGIVSEEDIRAVVSSVDRPVNVLIGLPGLKLNRGRLSELGVKRLSTGSALARTSIGALLRAARELRDDGTFGFMAEASSSSNIATLLKS